MNINFETTTCVFAHPKLEGIYYCAEANEGMTQDLNLASKFMGDKSRKRGLKKLQERFPNIKEGDLIYYYLTNKG